MDLLRWFDPATQAPQANVLPTELIPALETNEGKGKEIFYLTTHSTQFIYSYMASDIG